MSSETITRNDLANILNEIVAIDGTDMTAQEIADFVDSLNVTGIHAVDYVVEQGTDGIWTYRKWNSGVAECWGIRTGISASFSAWGNYWYYSSVQGVALPFTFEEIPVVTSHCYSSGGDIYATGASISGATGIPSTTNTGGITLYRGASLSSVTVNIQYYVIGRWK